MVNSTAQLTDISLRKIAALISQLPFVQVLGFITNILAIVGFFLLGTTVQDTSNNTEKFNLNKIITNQQEDSIKNLNTEMKIEFDSVKKIQKNNTTHNSGLQKLGFWS